MSLLLSTYSKFVVYCQLMSFFSNFIKGKTTSEVLSRTEDPSSSDLPSARPPDNPNPGSESSPSNLRGLDFNKQMPEIGGTLHSTSASTPIGSDDKHEPDENNQRPPSSSSTSTGSSLSATDDELEEVERAVLETRSTAQPKSKKVEVKKKPAMKTRRIMGNNGEWVDVPDWRYSRHKPTTHRGQIAEMYGQRQRIFNKYKRSRPACNSMKTLS